MAAQYVAMGQKRTLAPPKRSPIRWLGRQAREG